MLGPRLQGGTVTLEPPDSEQWSQVRLWFADVEVTRYTFSRWVSGEAAHRHWLQDLADSQEDVLWSIALDSGPIGITSLKDIDWVNRQAASNTLLGHAATWGRGYASEAVQLRTTFAFQELGLERLETESFAENIGMHRALKRSGYQQIGRRRHCIYRHGVWHDLLIFELLRSEWQEAEARGRSQQ